MIQMTFVRVWLLSPEEMTPPTYAFPYVLGVFVGLIAGVIVWTLVESGLKSILAPAYGKLLSKRPLTIFSVFTDSEDLIGFSTRFGENKKVLKLTFENNEIGRDFATLNLQEKS